MGLLVVVAALAGLWLLRREISWRETLLLSWIAAPALFFQLYPVKGYQYLIACAPPVVLLAGRTLACWQPSRDLSGQRDRAAPLADDGRRNAVAISLAIPALGVRRVPARRLLARGLRRCAGRPEARPLDSDELPTGAEFLTIGQSMANLVDSRGQTGLGFPVPRIRSGIPPTTPSQSGRRDPDQRVKVRGLGRLSASRSKFFARKLLAYAHRYHGVVLRNRSRDRAGQGPVQQSLIVVWGVRR